MKKKLHTFTKLLAAIIACCLSVAVYAQTTVSGTVTDTDGLPLTGATVIVITGNQPGGGTTTDANGKFTVTASAGQTLSVSYLGYKETTVNVTGSKSVYDIKLENDDAQIDEVIVVGYGTQKRVNVSGAVSTIDAKAFDKRPIVSASAALQGMAPGVTVTTQSGSPGGDGGSIRIRGINSFGGSTTDPLILIDGIVGDLNSVDPNLIENISVLKDAASASIYGSRAANGVILVTTKRGSQEKFSITYKGYVGWQSPTDLPDMVNAYEFRKLTNDMNINDGKDPTYDAESMALYKKNMGKDPDLYPNTDWQDAVLNGSGFTHSHNVSLGVSSDRVRMLTTLGYVDQEGIIKNAGYRRYTARSNADIKFNDKLTMKLDISFSNGDRKTSPYQSTIFNYMNTRPADITNKFSSGLFNGLGVQGMNPEALILYGGTNKTNALKLSGAITLSYQPVKWLTLQGMLAPRYETVNRHNWKKPVTTYQDVEGSAKLTSASFASLTESGSRSFYGNYNFLATFNHNFSGHDLKLILGAERNTYDYKYVMAYREGFNYDYDQIAAGDIENQKNDGYRYQWVLQSYFGRINYNYKERYLLEANLRIDGSSRFAKSNRWGYFPSVSGAWRISEEVFMQDIKHIVDGLKVRASYGTLGSQNLAGSEAANYYPTTQNLATGNISMNGNIYPLVTLNTMANAGIKWEETTMLNIGADVTLFGKLNISGDWYRKNTDGILMTLMGQLGEGLGRPYQNAGKVRNTGWELSIGYNNQWRDFTFGVQANVSDVKNKITDMKGMKDFSGVLMNQEGYSIGSIYALESLGIIRTQEEADWVNTYCPQFGETVQIGDIRYADTDGNEKIELADRTIVGSTIPRYTYSLNLNFGWKGIRLGLLFQGVGKVDGYLNTYYVMPSNQGGTFRKEHLDWAGVDNPNGKTPRLSSAMKNNWYDSSFWMKSAAYLRLKNIQLGYDLPKTWMRKIGLNSAYIYVNAQNLFTATNFWDGYDPEVGFGGDSGSKYDSATLGSANNYPQVKIVTVGLELKF
ncbi:TonB-dependent receptor [uncultured Alistipes sp.]|jgi:tonB-linked outer membrane protein, susC/ragA family|uniref:SusC/RagA family TonB-linked outer membrane protein n=1 Tax=uncultured Alistipes sp. TaxID=538949 RepID=UPI0025F3CBC5|nr:TonB-dependent receptor [uncultured Alistipes sp.]